MEVNCKICDRLLCNFICNVRKQENKLHCLQCSCSKGLNTYIHNLQQTLPHYQRPLLDGPHTTFTVSGQFMAGEQSNIFTLPMAAPLQNESSSLVST